MKDKQLIKDDINFLENPNWVVNESSKKQQLVIEKEKGIYQISCSEGLPTRFDKIVLYFLLYKLLENKNNDSNRISISRYEIARAVYLKKSLGKTEYDRIMLSLKKWKAILIKFEGIFYEKDNYTLRYFSVLDNVVLNGKNQRLYLKFNEDYVQQIERSKFYKYIDFDEYKKLIKPLSARLYEILIKTFKERLAWHIDIKNLAEKLTLEKRPQAKHYYPSDVLIKIKPAINEINKSTHLKIDFNYHKEDERCEFKKIVEAQEKRISIPITLIDSPSPSLQSLLAYGISLKKAQEIKDRYQEDKIKHKLELLKHSKQAIKNVAAWLIKALEEDWSTVEYDKQVELQKIKQEAEKKRELKRVQEKYIELLKQEYTAYKKAKAYELFNQSPEPVQNYINQEFELWLRTYGTGPLSKDDCKAAFIVDKLLNKQEYNFESWRAEQEKLVE
jgi:hypothetical protein